MDINSLYHGARKIAEMTKFPVDKVCLVSNHNQGSLGHSHAKVGIEFVGAHLFVLINEADNAEVILESGGDTWRQPLDKMTGTYVNPKMALAAAGMIIAGCDLMAGVEDVLLGNQHDGELPEAQPVAGEV